MSAIGTFPARGQIAAWLKAGVVEQGQFTGTERGTPQGGGVSPLLLNVALHGMEQAAGVRYYHTVRDGNPVQPVPNAPIVVRYADDLLALCHSREQAEQVKTRLSVWLAPRGLVFNEDKTRIVHLQQHGCDFLGFGIRRYRNGKLIIKPSQAAVKPSGNDSLRRYAPYGVPTPRRSLHGSTRSYGAGPATTAAWCRPRCSTRWTPTCSSSPTGGRYAGTATNPGSSGFSVGRQIGREAA